MPILPTTVIVFAVLLREVSIQTFLATGVECSSFGQRLLSPAAIECPSTPAASSVIMAVSLSVLIVMIKAVIVFIYKQSITSVSSQQYTAWAQAPFLLQWPIRYNPG